MPKPYRKTLESSRYIADIEVLNNGIPTVKIYEKGARPRYLSVSYIPTYEGSQPTISIRDAEYLTLDEARELADALPDAIRIAELAHAEVSKRFIMPEKDLAGDSNDRAMAIVRLIQTDVPLTSENINHAIASCYQLDDTSETNKALRAIRNVFADDSDVQQMVDTAERDACAYRHARDHEQELAHAPADEYDQMTHRAADMARTSAHNAFIRSMMALARLASSQGMKNNIADISQMPDPFVRPCREVIARMAYDMA